ncbi:PepSY domain-containing protein [Flammeovirga sp. SubArs3]|uniref:PepSY domain-containing protein n=1 Tax=Flammeovirga sp. SubArs3 TaxID=2995316 RepID=UPI00248B2822|nr:PepSY domain-containing protein [Flammeovirga sp. SubArs3]
MKNNTSKWMRIIHRYLGFFLAGIMAVYALSGVILIFRDTDFLKREIQYEKTVAPQLKKEELGKALSIRRLKVEKQEGDIMYFRNGTYNASTGEAKYSSKKLPFFIDKMTHMHKATSKSPLYFLNIFFGVSLLFFVVSTFFMFTPKTKIFKKGLYYTAGGIVLTIIVLFYE